MIINIKFTIEVDVQKYADEFRVSIPEAKRMIKGLVRDAGTAELISNGFIDQSEKGE
jgi:hypothetical protein